MRSTSRRIVVMIWLWTAAAVAPGMSQSVKSENKELESLQGVVTDASGVPMPGVTITVKGTSLSESRTVVTDADGGFTVVGLPRGEYDVDATLSGMKSGKAMVPLGTGGDVPQVKVKLAPADLSEPIVVTAVSPGVADGDTYDLGQPANKAKVSRGHLSFDFSVNARRLRTITPDEMEREVKQYAISPVGRKYITDSINRQDLANDVWSAAAKSHVDLAPEVDAAVRTEYLEAVRSLLDTGKVSEKDIDRVGAEVLSQYIADIAADKTNIKGIKSRLAENLKVGGAFLGLKRNSYGKLKVKMTPVVDEFVVRVDHYPFPSPQNPIVLVTGAHQVDVDVASKRQCSRSVTIEAGGLYPFECKAATLTP